MVYLKEVVYPRGVSNDVHLSLFEGDIFEDKEYEQAFHSARSVRYFLLEEVSPSRV